MKALTIQEPLATLLYTGRKTIETRVWAPSYRGPLLLTASRSPISPISGTAFAHCRLVDVRPMLKADEAAACCSVYEGAYAWILTDLVRLDPVVPIRGRLGLWDCELEEILR